MRHDCYKINFFFQMGYLSQNRKSKSGHNLNLDRSLCFKKQDFFELISQFTHKINKILLFLHS